MGEEEDDDEIEAEGRGGGRGGSWGVDDVDSGEGSESRLRFLICVHGADCAA